ncbi:DotU family type IV/VI secretion system protein, partial [Rhizobium sp. SEMIA 4085]|uniref:DotU family type IV/VI secretion system protein n=1 Tax=Rhizobium sp. SEMIA 4085 TaxID=2137761 RepID=UPI0032B106F2
MLPALAEPLLGLAKRAESEKRPDPQELAATARMLVAEFEKEGRRRNVPPDWILDARDALVVLLDVRVRSNPALPIRRWERALAAALPISHMIGADGLAERAAQAAKGGLARRDLARFLGHCSEAVQAAQTKEEQHRTRADRGLVGLPVALCFAVLGAGAGGAA